MPNHRGARTCLHAFRIATDFCSLAVFLDELLSLDASPEYLANQALSVIVAGRDTTAGALTACFYYLARHPEALRKCREEIKSSGIQNPTFEDLKNMKYLNDCVKEGK